MDLSPTSPISNPAESAMNTWKVNNSTKYYIRSFDVDAKFLSFNIYPVKDIDHILKSKPQKRKNDRVRAYSVEKEADTTATQSLYFEVQLSLGGGDIFFEHRTDVVRVDVNACETVIFPVKLNELPVQTAISIAMYDFNKQENNGLIGSTCFYLFDSKKRMRQGLCNLVIWNNVKPDLSYEFTTPGFPKDNSFARDINVLLNKVSLQEPRDDLNQVHKNPEEFRIGASPTKASSQTQIAIRQKLEHLYLLSPVSFLEISLPEFDYPVIHVENCYSSVIRDIIYPENLLESYNAAYLETPAPITEHKPPKHLSKDSEKISMKGSRVIRFHDSAIMRRQNLVGNMQARNNPVTDKYYILTRTEDDSISRELTPNQDTKKEILNVIELPDFTQLSHKDQNLLWKYRYSLKNDESYRKGVVKFLQSVNWAKQKEEAEAIEMLQDWDIDPEQALPMLSCIFSANEIYSQDIAKERCLYIRKRAIECLRKEEIGNLEMVLLQLVQAYRYEDFDIGLLKTFLLSIVTKNKSIAYKFFWIVRLEKNNRGNLPEIQHYFTVLYDEFMEKLEIKLPVIKKSLEKQVEFRDKLFELSNYIQKISGVDNKKNELRKVTKKGGSFDMANFEPTPMPLDPTVEV